MNKSSGIGAVCQRTTGQCAGSPGKGDGVLHPARRRCISCILLLADLDDVKSVARQVLRHRVVTNFAAEAAERSGDDLVAELVEGKSWKE
jgi:hypothetical protein